VGVGVEDRKIRVNVLTPGQVGSPMLAKVMDEEAKAQFRVHDPAARDGPP